MAEDLLYPLDSSPPLHQFPRALPEGQRARITRFSFAKQPDKGTLQPIDFTKGSADPGFCDVAELFGSRYAWRACISACEKKLEQDLPLRLRTQVEIALMNAQTQLKLAPPDTARQRRLRKGK